MINKEIRTDSNYYVYVYLDSRKPGTYKYGDLDFEFEPFYIGKGKLNRIKKHFYLCNKINTRFYSKMTSMINSNYEIIYYKLFDELTEIDALTKERKTINTIKRIEFGGPLTNLTDGGEGTSGLKMSDETKKKMSETKTGKKLGKMSDETKKNISISKLDSKSSMKGKNHTEVSKKLMSEKAKLRTGKKNSMYGKKHTEASKQKMRENTVPLTGKDNFNYGRTKPESEKISDTWKLTNKENEIVITKNLNKYCRENDLSSSCLRDIYYGRSKTHKNWIAVEKLTNNVKKKKYTKKS